MSYNYNSIDDYLQFRKDNCKLVSPTSIFPTRWYSLSYLWDESDKIYKNKKNNFFDKWDFFPLIIPTKGNTRKTAIASGKKYFSALNVHFLSIPERIHLFNGEGHKVSEDRLEKAVRNYRYENVKRCFFVPRKHLEEILLFYGDTYKNSSYGKVTKHTKSSAKSFIKHYNEDKEQLTMQSIFEAHYYNPKDIYGVPYA